MQYCYHGGILGNIVEKLMSGSRLEFRVASLKDLSALKITLETYLTLRNKGILKDTKDYDEGFKSLFFKVLKEIASYDFYNKENNTSIFFNIAKMQGANDFYDFVASKKEEISKDNELKAIIDCLENKNKETKKNIFSTIKLKKVSHVPHKEENKKETEQENVKGVKNLAKLFEGKNTQRTDSPKMKINSIGQDKQH